MAIVWGGGQTTFQNRVVWGMRPKATFSLSRKRRLQLEAAAQGLAALIAVGMLGAVGIKGFDTVKNRFALAALTPTVPVTVESGDSLWTLAQRYGNPDVSQWDRVDTLAQANGLSAGDTLRPGQRLMVRVENPDEAARLHPMMAQR